jgi:aldose 1-epimerase
VLPARGFNCISFQVPQAGTPLEILWTVKDFVSGQARPASSGIPILFPFPGRLAGTHFTFEGRRYELEGEDALGNAIHGFVLKRPWPVIEQLTHRVVGRITASKDIPDVLKRWPSDFQITATYEVAASRLTLTIEIVNVGSGPLPFGLGTHPYFRVPIGGADAGACRITVPVRQCWELRDMLPTGKLLSATEAGLPPDGILFSAARFDHVFTDVIGQNGRATATIADPGSGRTTRLTFDDSFRECVVYTPHHREAICVEPYTCVPDAYGLQQAGHETGLRVLQPGESFQVSMDVAVK